MAIRTNSKQARKNVVDYIRKYAEDHLEENGLQGCSDAAMLENLRETFAREVCFKNNMLMYRGNVYMIFREEWAKALAMDGLFCYYYNRSAKDDLGAILQETEEEKAKYTEEQAEELLTRLIFRAVQEGK